MWCICIHMGELEISRRIIQKAWNKGRAGLKKKTNSARISLGNFRLVNNNGKLNKADVRSSGNKKWVWNSSDVTKYRGQLAVHKVGMNI